MAVRAVLDHRPRRPFFRGRDPAQPLRRMDPGQDRETSGTVGGAGRRRAGARILRRVSNALKTREALCRFAASGYAASMIFRSNGFVAQVGTYVVTAVAAVSVLLLVTSAGSPQSAPPPPSSPGVQPPAQQAAPPQAEPAAPREENPGLINELERLWDKSRSMLPTLKSPQETI